MPRSYIFKSTLSPLSLSCKQALHSLQANTSWLNARYTTSPQCLAAMPLQLHCLFKYSHMTCFTPLLKWRACLPARYSCQFSVGLCGKDSYFTGKDPCSSPPPPPGSLPPSQQRTVLNLPFWDSTLLIYIPFQTLSKWPQLSFTYGWECVFSLHSIIPAKNNSFLL